MSSFIAALPMYDWAEARAEVDASWARLRAQLRAAGVDAPERLARRNGDLPAVPGGIRDAEGRVIAPDPATLPAEELDLPTLWRHPRLLFGQTCRGPMETTGLAAHVQVLGEPDYSAIEGGKGTLYSSAILMCVQGAVEAPSPDDGRAMLPLDLLRGRRFAFNGPDSMSGLLAIERDLEAAGEGLALFSGRSETGSHRASMVTVAEGRADFCAVDCLTWHLARRFEPAAEALRAVGWTARRPGLPYICARGLPDEIRQMLQGLVAGNEIGPGGLSRV